MERKQLILTASVLFVMVLGLAMNPAIVSAGSYHLTRSKTYYATELGWFRNGGNMDQWWENYQTWYKVTCADCHGWGVWTWDQHVTSPEQAIAVAEDYIRVGIFRNGELGNMNAQGAKIYWHWHQGAVTHHETTWLGFTSGWSGYIAIPTWVGSKPDYFNLDMTFVGSVFSGPFYINDGCGFGWELYDYY